MASVWKRGGNKNRKSNWWYSYVDHTGKRISRSSKTKDKATAERIANKAEADAALRREGVIDPTAEAMVKEGQRSIESHLADYEAKLRTAGRDDKHVGSTLQKHPLRSVAWLASSLSDVAADPVSKFAATCGTKVAQHEPLLPI